MSAAVVIDAVSRHYGKGQSLVEALTDVSLSVGRQEFVAVMGPSGSGKSTLLALAGGLDQPSSGTVTVAGTPLTGRSRDELAAVRRRTLGFVFQEYNLVPTLTAVENVALPLELDGTSAANAHQQAIAALDRVGIADLAQRTIDQMSGGQAQRVAIARAVVGDRRVVLADEPTGALDTTTGDEVMALLRELADDGVAIVMVTHEARHAGWADRVVFLRDGRIVDESRADHPSMLLRRAAPGGARRAIDPSVDDDLGHRRGGPEAG